MEHIVVNGSVHTGCKQCQRVCTQICVQMCLRVLCERGLNWWTGPLSIPIEHTHRLRQCKRGSTMGFQLVNPLKFVNTTLLVLKQGNSVIPNSLNYTGCTQAGELSSACLLQQYPFVASHDLSQTGAGWRYHLCEQVGNGKLERHEWISEAQSTLDTSMQICRQFLWYCWHPVWTLAFTTAGSICLCLHLRVQCSLGLWPPNQGPVTKTGP